MDYSAFPIPNRQKRVKLGPKDGRLVLSRKKYQQLRESMFYPGIPCGICGEPISYFYQFTLEHWDGRGMGAGRRDDRNVVPAHWICNMVKGSRRAGAK